jgi:putative FmdB family regulatory protein
MPYYLHECKACNEEFEDFYSIVKDPPTLCPMCGVDGQVKRLISSATSGKVTLQGQELQQHIKDENKKNLHKFKTDERTRSNIIGEERYEASVKEKERINNRYKGI